ncbi:outer membrane protein assembly factor BamA [Mesorhizobium microcysteis]|uniref:Outer membrane protein assembly factor BamA n=1 Tax=Neoaquamicrobium microcysteis TaxID=2682781 RepID=A0A5D4H4T0_9HYPH|nr:outer membrane protein assembly factor BamA [Mesorhizobium microcysteis]TYR33810.1 outer membrane protein assembly factor BamA [Mesorhizobium microcysteis]
MKAASSLLSAASAVALSTGVVLSGAGALQLATLSVAQAAVVSSIEVRGNSRVDAETIRNYVAIRPGANFTSGDIDEAVKRLFATGLFSDVRINQSGSTLVISVDENAIVNNVLFQGNRKIKDADLARQIQVQPRGSYSTALMDADIETIKQAYGRIGRDDAVVTGQVVDLGEGRVNVVYNVQEGGRTKIASITFEGNSAFSDGRLREVVSTKQSNILSVLTRNDIYDEDRLRADEEALRRFYYNRGYADFRVLSSVGQFDEAANAYRISFSVDEGQRYTFGNVDVESTIEGLSNEQLRAQVKSRPGSYYSAKDVEDSIVGLSERVADLGYAFAQVTPRGDRNFENQTISVVYTIDEGPRAYIERIEIRGNQRTRDYVIRREFDVSEGDAFNQVLIQRAKRRLEALDFFETVNIATAPGSEPDQVVLVVDVIEKSTGELSIGGGYTTGSGPTAGFSVEGSVAERNFLGRGQSIRLAVGAGKNSRDYTLSFTEPYFLGRRISAGFDIYRQTREFNQGYNSELTGGTVRFGLPITEALSTQLAYNLTQEKYKYSGVCVDANGNPIPNDPRCTLSDYLKNAIENESPWTKSSVSGSLIFNTIDDMRNPRDGLYANTTLEVAGLGGDARWAKITARGSYYQTLSSELDLVGVLSAGAGHIQAYGDNDIRVFDNFQNSDRMIRGFKNNGIGPYQTTTDTNGNTVYNHLGGTTYFNASAEAQFPMPLIPTGIGLRGAVFADAATLYGTKLSGFGPIQGTELEWRASVGASLIWASPFGPLRVDYAVPVVKEEGDQIQNFSFGISTRF